MNILGIDYGEKHLGIAIAYNGIVEPIKNKQINKSISNKQILQIKELSSKLKIEKIVIGVSSGKMAEKTRKFGEKLEKSTGLSVEYVDETMTSEEAKKIMLEIGKKKKKRQKNEHTVAACLILESYLPSAL